MATSQRGFPGHDDSNVPGRDLPPQDPWPGDCVATVYVGSGSSLRRVDLVRHVRWVFAHERRAMASAPRYPDYPGGLPRSIDHVVPRGMSLMFHDDQFLTVFSRLAGSSTMAAPSRVCATWLSSMPMEMSTIPGSRRSISRSRRVSLLNMTMKPNHTSSSSRVDPRFGVSSCAVHCRLRCR